MEWGRSARTMENALKGWADVPVSELAAANRKAGSLLRSWPNAFEDEIRRSVEILPKGGSVLNALGLSFSALLEWKLPEELAFVDSIVSRITDARWVRFGMLSSQDEAKTLDRRGTPEGGVVEDRTEVSMPGDTISVRDAANILGTDVRAVLSLFPSWHVSRRIGPTGKPTTPRVVSKASVFELYDRLCAIQNPWVDEPTSQYMTLEEARQTSWYLNIETARLLEAIGSGLVRVACEPDRKFSLGTAYLNSSDLVSWWGHAADAIGIDEISLSVGRQMLNLNKLTTSRLLELEYLKLSSVGSTEQRSKVRISAVLRACSSIRLASRIGVFSGIRSDELISILGRAGAGPITGSQAGSREYKLIRESDLRLPGVFEILAQRAKSKWGH
jgi:hypothetical protein